MEKFKLANLTIINNNLKENTQEIFRRAHNDCPNLSTTIYKKKTLHLMPLMPIFLLIVFFSIVIIMVFFSYFYINI